MQRTYTVVVERDTESDWLVAEVVELPGCYTQGRTMAELEERIADAIRAYLAATEVEEPSTEYVATWRVELPA